MIMLLALPVVAAVALAHRYLVLNAPSNVLIRRVRASAPTLRKGAAMLALSAVLLLAMKAVSDGIAAGAPGWLNLVLVVLGWDAIKFAMLAAIELWRVVIACLKWGAVTPAAMARTKAVPR